MPGIKFHVSWRLKEDYEKRVLKISLIKYLLIWMKKVCHCYFFNIVLPSPSCFLVGFEPKTLRDREPSPYHKIMYGVRPNMVWSCRSDQFQFLINLICLTMKKLANRKLQFVFIWRVAFCQKWSFRVTVFCPKKKFQGCTWSLFAFVLQSRFKKTKDFFSMKEITLLLLLLLSLLSSQCCSILTRSFITSECPCIWLGILLFNIVERKTNKLHLSYLHVLRYFVSIHRLACDWKIRKRTTRSLVREQLSR